MPKPIGIRTDEDWDELIQAQRSSKLSVAAFCRQHAINQQAFLRHRDKWQIKCLQDAVEDFVQISPSDQPIKEATTAVREEKPTISLNVGQVNVCFCEKTSPQWVAQLIREVAV